MRKERWSHVYLAHSLKVEDADTREPTAPFFVKSASKKLYPSPLEEEENNEGRSNHVSAIVDMFLGDQLVSNDKFQGMIIIMEKSWI